MKQRDSIDLTVQDWESCYLWTFTFPDQVKDVTILSTCWNRFMSKLRRYCQYKERINGNYSSLKMIRVYEWHPDGHGLHVHFLCDKRLDVRAIRMLSNESGFGRIHVQKIEKTASNYVAKYLNKKRNFPKGTRAWGHCGYKNNSYTRIRDLFYDSEIHRIFRKIKGDSAGKCTNALAMWNMATSWFCRGDFWQLVDYQEIQFGT